MATTSKAIMRQVERARVMAEQAKNGIDPIDTLVMDCLIGAPTEDAVIGRSSDRQIDEWVNGDGVPGEVLRAYRHALNGRSLGGVPVSRRLRELRTMLHCMETKATRETVIGAIRAARIL